ncbi:MAG: hypothetical protein ETSY1_38735 [Candidatus Entotheonella factor]|uniref:Uncharacterized protein n=1 Tax=Entotheonella factor TaxID=1429438 RepID=W4L616_ENTF1|nr:MAG: hypothetical protein ETSY1_38735 [Candidatus Entotheonella factor]
MIQPILKIVAVLTLLGFTVTGCATTEQYARFAQAGSTYTAALDAVLVASARVHVDATSEKLISEDSSIPLTRQDYEGVAKDNMKRVEIIQRLRQHGRLLTQYFDLLNQLATSEAPAAIQDAGTNVINRINEVGTILRGDPLVEDTGVFTPVVEAVVNLKMRQSLKEELQTRQKTIELELKTQEILLMALSTSIQHDHGTTQEKRTGSLR